MHNKIRNFELDIIRSLRNINSSFLDSLFQIFTMFGEQFVLIFLLAIIYFLYDKKLGQFIAYSIFTTLLINNTLKCIVKYTRPFIYDPTIKAVRTETATGFSFPSGHTQNTATFYTSIAHNFDGSKKTKKIFWTTAIIITILVAFSRVFLGVHYPKDVIVGVILGLFITFLCSYLYNKVYQDTKKTFILLIITNVIFIPFLFIFFKKNYQDIYIYRDFYISYALFTGYILALVLDLKYVNFTTNTTLKKKILRLLFALVVFVIIEFGIKKLFNVIAPDGFILFDFLRYFLISFCILGLYPFLFRKTLFKD